MTIEVLHAYQPNLGLWEFQHKELSLGYLMWSDTAADFLYRYANTNIQISMNTSIQAEAIERVMQMYRHLWGETPW